MLPLFHTHVTYNDVIDRGKLLNVLTFKKQKQDETQLSLVHSKIQQEMVISSLTRAQSYQLSVLQVPLLCLWAVSTHCPIFSIP